MGRVIGCREYLIQNQLTAQAVPQDNIGEGTTDIDANPPTGFCVEHRPSSRDGQQT